MSFQNRSQSEIIIIIITKIIMSTKSINNKIKETITKEKKEEVSNT